MPVQVRTPLNFKCMHIQSCPTLCWTPWTVAHQASLSVEFSRQEFWSGLPFPNPGDLPDPGIEPNSFVAPAFQAGFYPCATLILKVLIIASIFRGGKQKLRGTEKLPPYQTARRELR